ncbi:gamma-glutamylcyclotransferase family protein [Maribacter sp. R77961]|uniref:gamma-glutamylcyclotransferase family protein n=1 Tax=Maribacter sp. R77961 TaxID=3093871 RepID=UPI0037C72308
MTYNVFVYGTLMNEKVFFSVTRENPNYQEAILENHFRFALKKRVYPGILKNTNSNINGLLVENISKKTLILLDLFEDSIYDRRSLEIKKKDFSYTRAYVYVLKDRYKYLSLGKSWDLDNFEKNNLNEYLIGCREFYINNINCAFL